MRPVICARFFGPPLTLRFSWDDWVLQDRLRKLTDDNRELASQLKKEAHAQQESARKAASKPTPLSKARRAQGSEMGSGRGSEERQASVPAGGRGTKRGRDNDIEKVGGPSSSLSLADMVERALSRGRRRVLRPPLPKLVDYDSSDEEPDLPLERMDPEPSMVHQQSSPGLPSGRLGLEESTIDKKDVPHSSSSGMGSSEPGLMDCTVSDLQETDFSTSSPVSLDLPPPARTKDGLFPQAETRTYNLLAAQKPVKRPSSHMRSPVPSDNEKSSNVRLSLLPLDLTVSGENEQAQPVEAEESFEALVKAALLRRRESLARKTQQRQQRQQQLQHEGIGSKAPIPIALSTTIPDSPRSRRTGPQQGSTDMSSEQADGSFRPLLESHSPPTNEVTGPEFIPMAESSTAGSALNTSPGLSQPLQPRAESESSLGVHDKLRKRSAAVKARSLITRQYQHTPLFLSKPIIASGSGSISYQIPAPPQQSSQKQLLASKEMGRPRKSKQTDPDSESGEPKVTNRVLPSRKTKTSKTKSYQEVMSDSEHDEGEGFRSTLASPEALSIAKSVPPAELVSPAEVLKPSEPVSTAESALTPNSGPPQEPSSSVRPRKVTVTSNDYPPYGEPLRGQRESDRALVDDLLSRPPPPDEPEYVSHATFASDKRDAKFWAPLISGTTQEEQHVINRELEAKGKYIEPQKYHREYIKTKLNDPGNLNRLLFFEGVDPNAKLATAGVGEDGPLHIDPPGSGGPFDALKFPQRLVAMLNRNLDQLDEGWDAESLKKIPSELIEQVDPPALARMPDEVLLRQPVSILSKLPSSAPFFGRLPRNSRLLRPEHKQSLRQPRRAVRPQIGSEDDTISDLAEGSPQVERPIRQPVSRINRQRTAVQTTTIPPGIVPNADGSIPPLSDLKCATCKKFSLKCNGAIPVCRFCEINGLSCSNGLPEEFRGAPDTRIAAEPQETRTNIYAAIGYKYSPSTTHPLNGRPPFDPSWRVPGIDNLANWQYTGITQIAQLHDFVQNAKEYAKPSFDKQEENFLSRPSIRIVVPDNIKALLVDDWENVTKQLLLVPLPSRRPANYIIDTYWNEEKVNRRLGSAEADILQEFCVGLKVYFEKSLGKILLYRFERSQLNDVCTAPSEG